MGHFLATAAVELTAEEMGDESERRIVDVDSDVCFDGLYLRIFKLKLKGL